MTVLSPDQRRALMLLANRPDGCTRAGRATTATKIAHADRRPIVVVRLRITVAGDGRSLSHTET